MTATQTINAASQSTTDHLHAIVDIGSNGVRFSITDLSPPTSRILPTLYQDRAGISLYDAQHNSSTKAPIAQDIIDSIITNVCRFKTTCEDFQVPSSNVRVIATEATREAQNSQHFRDELEKATGWKVDMLSKEEEGRIGAQGIASSLAETSGLVMDLGGGSTQLSWMISLDGKLDMAEKAISLPYGAAALTKRLTTAINAQAIEDIRSEIHQAFTEKLETLNIPKDLRDLADEDGGFTLFLSGGGFRGFGYLLLADHELQPYPIAIINGFSVPAQRFTEQAEVQLELEPETTEKLRETFRISDRRASQVPAVAFLIHTLMQVLPKIKTVVFCQGGVREGCLFDTLSPEVRSRNPIVVATTPFASHAADEYLRQLNNALPTTVPREIWQYVTPAVANLITYHSNIPKESRAAAALHFTTTGQLASAHGLTHNIRALLALALCERWGGETHNSSFRHRLEKLAGPELTWWARYVGRIAGLLGTVYPAGLVRHEKVRLFAMDGKKNGVHEIDLKVYLKDDDPDLMALAVQKAVESVEKAGKKKSAVMGFRRKIILLRDEL